MLTALTPRHLLRTAVDLELQCARALEIEDATGGGALLWAEHGNRLHVFTLFQYADVALGGTHGADLGDLLRRAARFDPYDRVWVAEGVGYLWGDRLTAALPAWSLVPLHSGVGLAVARRLLDAPPARTPGDVVAAVVERCAECAVPGFESVAVETIGLAVRNLHPQQMACFGGVLGDWDAELYACFWHGAGRGAYFATSNWRASGDAAGGEIDQLCRQAPTDAARANILSGFAWGATLVNLRTPRVLDHYVAQLCDERDAAAFADGVTASLVVWQHAAPDDEWIPGMLETDGLVAEAVEASLSRYPAIAAAGCVQDVFHCEVA